MGKVLKNLSIYLLIVLVVLALLKYGMEPAQEIVTFRYDEFIELVEAERIHSVTMYNDGTLTGITGQRKDGTKFQVNGPPVDDQLFPLLKMKGVQITQEQPPNSGFLVGLLPSLIPIAILLLLFFFLMQQTQGGGNRVMSFGKSKARLHTEDKQKVTFEDVAGVEETKEELAEVVEFLKKPDKFNEIGARIPKG
ncbi:MAG TPA: ATP-dependent metallopeptidase FtsH/Yme1/Tma family protein, partial [Clostridia bacterium]|nr:ATP-dependent metallopeptidase FtsH/Yme1/Tma family protein [Clostridia bacterium]